VAPQDVIKQYGAEILRLWVAAQDYQEDLRISQQILKQLVEGYRKIRNTCRYLLSNIYDYDPSNPSHQIEVDQLPEIDRWALMRLNKLNHNVRKGYKEFDFRQIVHELDYFCSVDMSATYLDILKDRLYTFPKESPLRRGSQMVLCKIVTSLAQLMAPILSFTAEDVWDALHGKTKDQPGGSSVHVGTFPEAVSLQDPEGLEAQWKELLAIRTLVLGALEQQRREKVIGSSLEARVVLQTTPDRYRFLQQYQQDLPTLFIVSQVTVEECETISITGHLAADPALGISVDVTKADDEKCERCWNYRPTVGTQSQHPTLCDRCIEAVS